jgi:hypothetical protein
MMEIGARTLIAFKAYPPYLRISRGGDTSKIARKAQGWLGGAVMEADHYLQFERLNLTKRVYRYISLTDLYRIFDNRENGLRQPSLWRDPFENFVMDSYLDGETGSGIAWRDRVFAQCWTVERHSDAMWQIFCGDPDGPNPGVRIRTTIGKLGSSLTSALAFGESQQAFIGQVRYPPDKKLIPETEAVFSQGVSPRRVAESLLIKRRPFRHEREVRIVTRALWAEPDNGFLNYSIDPHALIESIVVDPRVDVKRQSLLKSEIRERTRYEGELLWSTLYHRPSYMRLHLIDSGS